MRGPSGATSNAEILRNALAPEGFGRRRTVCFVAAPPRCSGIAFVADALHPAQRRSERDPCEFSHGLLPWAVRILHLVAGMKWTGPAAVAIDQVRALREAGVEAEVAFTGGGGLEERLASHGWARPLFAPPGRIPRRLADASRLARMLRRERFEMIHCHLTHDHLAVLLAPPGRRLPIIRTFHHDRQLRRDPITLRLVRRASGAAFSNVVIAEKFARLFGRGMPGVVLPPVAELEAFHPGSKDPALAGRFGLRPEGFLVGTIGKMAPGRGQDAALRILARTAHPEICLLQIGKGESQESLRQLAARLGVAGRNFETGYQEEALPDIYRLMDAFLFTASGSDQGHRAILEAMASGVPVVALPVGGVADYRLEAGPGFRAPSEEAAASCLDFLFEHPKERGAMGRAGRERSLAFSGARFAARAMELYAEVFDRFRK
jgi:glycosyltransferase involved in cell wall biosynthesis